MVVRNARGEWIQKWLELDQDIELSLDLAEHVRSFLERFSIVLNFDPKIIDIILDRLESGFRGIGPSRLRLAIR